MSSLQDLILEEISLILSYPNTELSEEDFSRLCSLSPILAEITSNTAFSYEDLEKLSITDCDMSLLSGMSKVLVFVSEDLQVKSVPVFLKNPTESTLS
ncbi:hypothetical protein DSO57_1025267 [Entomophthora muscae]|uniref:Uncharacterized protein n=1 Tax=Entomophthora muscae TaxID=34485 RepID=A0ACC2SRR4_9FUNG|nr:hypothetical protein DSO57_1025267 [Entomophthora muscae]